MEPEQSPYLSLVDPQRAVSHAVQSSNGDLAAAISTGVLRMLDRHTGRGSTKAKTTVSGDLVVVTLSDCLTTVERLLADAGHIELVVLTRNAVHHMMRAEAMALVAEITHQEVLAYLTDQELDPDFGVMVFPLAPLPDGE